MSEYEIWRCVECGAEFDSPTNTSEGYSCPYCGSSYLISESELEGYDDWDPADEREYMEEDIDFGDEDDDYAY